MPRSLAGSLAKPGPTTGWRVVLVFTLGLLCGFNGGCLFFLPLETIRMAAEIDRHDRERRPCARLAARKRTWARQICAGRDSCACDCAKAGKFASRLDESGQCHCAEAHCYDQYVKWCSEDEAACKKRFRRHLLSQP